MEEHAGGDDGDDLPGQPCARRRLVQEQRGQHGTAVTLQDDDEGGGQGRGEAGQARHQGAGAARSEKAQHQQERREGEQGGQGRLPRKAAAKRGSTAACAVSVFRLEPAPCPDSSAGRARHS